MTRHRQTGAALLMAMLTVTLVATFAAATLWQQYRGVEVEAAERNRMQSAWILSGALDWSRVILREDAKAGGADHLSEPWALPLQEARLSTFLAAEKNMSTEGVPEDAFLSGQIIDLQSRLNLGNLVENGRVSEPARQSIARLFERLGLPEGELNRLIDGLRRASDGGVGGNAALMPQHVEQLSWLGLSAETVAALAPHTVLLPSRSPVNLNTASVDVVYAALPGLSLAQAQQVVTARQAAPFKTLGDAASVAAGSEFAFSQGTVSVTTRFFEVRGRLRLGAQAVEERSLLQRDGVDVRVLWRERGSFVPTMVRTP